MADDIQQAKDTGEIIGLLKAILARLESIDEGINS